MTDQPKEYYEKKPGFIVKSGTEDFQGKTIDYAVFTDYGQGFEFTTDGQHRQQCKKTSYELCGVDGTDGEPAKVIRAKKGDIIIEAMDGDIILRGKNVRIVALDGAGEVTVVSGKHFSVNAPVQSLKGSNSNTVMSNSASTGAQATDTTGNMQLSQNSGVEEAQSSILSRLLGIVKKFQKFLE
jgi:ribulose bisphosphate carboxylase small subunit